MTATSTVAGIAPRPMLASAQVQPVTGAAFDARYGTGEWVLERKHDGHRRLVRVTGGVVEAWSRPRGSSKVGLAVTLGAHLVEQLRHFPDGDYDGEEVAPSGKCKDVKRRGGRNVLVLFDVTRLDGQSLLDWTYDQRREALLDVLARMPEDQTAITTVLAERPRWALVEAIWRDGGEGAVLKKRSSRYVPGWRSPEWVKVKRWCSATVTITGYLAAKSGPYSCFVLRDAEGNETSVGVPTHALKREVARAPEMFLGQRVVISYQERTPAGSYRHPGFDHFAGEGE